MRKCCRLVAIFCNNTMENCAAGYLIFTRIQGLEARKHMPSRNVLGVVIKKEFKTRQAFKCPTSSGGFTHTIF